MEVRWSLPAAEDLERICTWIERDNPEAARRVAKTIFDGCTQLKNLSLHRPRQSPHARPARTGISAIALCGGVPGQGTRR